MKIIFLTTVYNRRDKTLRSLAQLVKVCDQLEGSFEFVVVDDGSVDGTAEAIYEVYPQVNVVMSPGGLYWAGGMRFGFSWIEEKFGSDYDFLVAFNDDCDFLVSCICNTLDCRSQDEVLIGAFSDSNGALSYGGRKHQGRWPLDFAMPKKSDLGCLVEVGNFNFAVIPSLLLRKIPLIDTYFQHNGADYDFCLRARQKGYRIRMSSEILGYVDRNGQLGTSQDITRSFGERFRALIGVKEYPISQRWIFVKRFGGRSWLIWFFRPYLGFFIKYLIGR